MRFGEMYSYGRTLPKAPLVISRTCVAVLSAVYMYGVVLRHGQLLLLLVTLPDRLYGLVVRVLGYRSGGPGSIPGTTIKKSSGSGTRSTQPHEYN
jgi:hypothetical protein